MRPAAPLWPLVCLQTRAASRIPSGVSTRRFNLGVSYRFGLVGGGDIMGTTTKMSSTYALHYVDSRVNTGAKWSWAGGLVRFVRENGGWRGDSTGSTRICTGNQLCNLLTTLQILYAMSDMLKQFHAQLKAKREELRQAEDERKVLQGAKEDAMYAVHEAAENLKQHDRKIKSIKNKIENIQNDIESLTGP